MSRRRHRRILHPQAYAAPHWDFLRGICRHRYHLRGYRPRPQERFAVTGPGQLELGRRGDTSMSGRADAGRLLVFPGMRSRTRHSRRASDGRKSRVPILVVNSSEDMTISLGRPVDGVVPLLDGITGKPIPKGILQTGVSYDRGDKPPKILTLGVESNSCVGPDPDRRLHEFDHLFAVDTNTDPDTGRSVTVIARVTDLSFGEGTKTLTIGFPPARIWCGPLTRPERTGWHLALSSLICC